MTILENTFKDIALSEIYEFDGYFIFMRKDGFVQLQFKNGFNGDVADAKNMINTFKKLSPDKRVVALIIYQEDNMFSKETREFIASDEVTKIVKADALVIKGLALKIIGNGYLRINKPKRPTRMFNSQESAIK